MVTRPALLLKAATDVTLKEMSVAEGAASLLAVMPCATKPHNRKKNVFLSQVLPAQTTHRAVPQFAVMAQLGGGQSVGFPAMTQMLSF